MLENIWDGKVEKMDKIILNALDIEGKHVCIKGNTTYTIYGVYVNVPENTSPIDKVNYFVPYSAIALVVINEISKDKLPA